MTRVFQVPPRDVDPSLLEEAAGILRAGGVVGFPTETVYGLGASTRSPEGIERLMEIKGRPNGKPFSYHMARVEEIRDIAEVPPLAAKLLERYAPGPITLVLPSRHDPSLEVGVRVPANEIARKLIELVGAPLFVPSANPSGQPPALSSEEVLRYFDRKIDAVVDGGTALLKEASTVVRIAGSGYQVLREGIITKEMVHQCIEGRRILFVCTGNTCRSPMAAELFRKHLAKKLGKDADELNELGYRVGSAGTFAAFGSPPSEHAVTVLAELGLDLSRHHSQPVTPELLAGCDHVYTMSSTHYQVLQRLCEELPATARPRVDRLADECITDPVGGDLETYRRCAKEIEEAIRRILGV
jgi:tRNA threonylcarbamoyl adenosine modification protein (Sua5/YciO/YrdC/YwlC family)